MLNFFRKITNKEEPSLGAFPLIACLVWICVILNQAYFQGIFEVSEAREGVVVNEIKSYGTWILPLRHGEVIPSKPPLFHWIAAALSFQVDYLNEFFLRLPSIVASLLSLFLVYKFVKKTHRNSETAFNAVLITSSTYGFLQLSLDGRVDMLFTFFFLASLLFINKIILNKDLNTPTLQQKIILGLIIGLSILTRGPLGPVLTFTCLISGLIVLNQYKNFKSWFFENKFLLILLPILISAPWYLASKFLGKPELVSRQLIFENVSRFFGSDKIPSKPFWFYLQHLPIQLTIWTLFLVIIGLIVLKHNAIFEDKKIYNTVKLLSIQIISIFVFLSLASGKRRAYLLQILPLLGILLALSYSQLKDHNYFKKLSAALLEKNYLVKISKSLIIIFFLITILKLLLIFLNIFSDVYILTALNKLTWYSLIIPGLILLLLHVYLTYSTKNKSLKIIPALWIVTMQIYLALPGYFFLIKGESHSLKAFASEIKSQVKTDDLTLIKKVSDESFDSFLFYYGKRVKLAPLETLNLEENSFYMSRKTWLNKQESLENVDVIFESKRLADKEKNLISLFKKTTPHQDYAE